MSRGDPAISEALAEAHTASWLPLDQLPLAVSLLAGESGASRKENQTVCLEAIAALNSAVRSQLLKHRNPRRIIDELCLAGISKESAQMMVGMARRQIGSPSRGRR